MRTSMDGRLTVHTGAPGMVRVRAIASRAILGSAMAAASFVLVSTTHADPGKAGAGNGSVVANRPMSLPRDDHSQSPGANKLRDEIILAQAGPVKTIQDTPGRSADERQATVQTQSDAIIESINVSRRQVEHLTVGKNASLIINTKVNVDSVQIADPSVADVVLTSPRQIVVAGKSFGSTQLVLRAGSEDRTFHVTCELDLAPLEGLIKSVSPQSEVAPRSINGNIVLTGNVPDSETAERIGEMAGMLQGSAVQNHLSIAGNQQVMLRVVVAEVNKEAMRQLGVNWAIGGSDWTRDFFLANNLGQLNPTNISNNGVTNMVVKNSLGGQLTYAYNPVGTGPNTNITFGFPRAELQFFLNALRENNLSRILAEPNLVAISGQTATFLAGGEVPIPVTQGGAVAGAVTIEYKEFGVRLAFSPTVMEGQLVRIHVMTEFSDAIPGASVIGGLPVFTFTTRRVESTVECGNGQTFAVGGLLSERVQALASKIPGLGDIPVLGTLFSSTQYQRANTELVILVTPQLVEPMDPQQVPPVPGQLMTHPNDFELFVMQQLEGTPRERTEPDGVPREHFDVKSRPQASAAWPSSQLALVGPWGLSDGDD